MKTYYSRIEAGTGFYILLAVLGMLALCGLYSAYLMYTQGHYLTGMNNQIAWGLPIVMTIFLIGVSAGSLVLSSLGSVFGQTQFKCFSRIAAYLAALLLIGALLSLVLDLGRPERIALPFFFLNPKSVFSWNGFLYSIYILISFVYLWAMFKEKDKLVKALGILAVVWAVGVHSGTGSIFGFVKARELFHSPLTLPSFVVAAISSGTGLMIILLSLTFKLTKRYLDPRLIIGLSRLLVAFILIVFYVLLVENLTRLYNPDTYEANFYFLFSGDVYSWLFWLGLIIIGSVIPAIILFAKKTKDSVGWINFASVLVVIGVFCERLIIVLPGQVHPLNLFPDKVLTSQFMDGVMCPYIVSLPEIVFAIGIVAIVAILYLLGLRFLSLMPDEAGERQII